MMENKKSAYTKKQTAIICDLDGTLALFDENKNLHDRDYINDHVSKAIKYILYSLAKIYNYKIILLTGRKNNYLQETKNWLLKNDITYHELHMPRNVKDRRKDYVVKKEAYEKYIKDKYEIAFVLEDRTQVVKMWREIGLTCYQVAEGNY